MLENQDEKINEAVALVTEESAGQGGDENVEDVINDPNVMQAADSIDEKPESQPDSSQKSVKDMLTKMLNNGEGAQDGAPA